MSIDPLDDCRHTPAEHRARAQVLLASVRRGWVEGETAPDGTVMEHYGPGAAGRGLGDEPGDLTTITHLLAALTHAVLAIHPCGEPNPTAAERGESETRDA